MCMWYIFISRISFGSEIVLYIIDAFGVAVYFEWLCLKAANALLFAMIIWFAFGVLYARRLAILWNDHQRFLHELQGYELSPNAYNNL